MKIISPGYICAKCPICHAELGVEHNDIYSKTESGPLTKVYWCVCPCCNACVNLNKEDIPEVWLRKI